MSTIREGVVSFLSAREDHSPFLVPRWSPELETQYLVHPGTQEVEEGSKCWTDGREQWANHRWPYKANSDPHYKDRPLTFNPAVHMARIGSTWWNWVNKESVAVAFDIDMEGEHAASTTTVTEKELEGVVERLKQLPYLTLVRSTGGSGVHVYAFFDEEHRPKAENHNEHTQVAIATLDKMCEDAEYDFSQHMDVKGVVFWFWSDTSPADHPGFSLIQEQTISLKSEDVEGRVEKLIQPNNRALKVHGFMDDGNPVSHKEDGEYQVYDLDGEHKEILKQLEELGYSFIWNAEFNMVHTHTCALKELYHQRAQTASPIRGKFDTISQGTDKTKPNCYITPRPGGVFQVKRFGNGIAEHPSWTSQDGGTWCYFNQDLDPDNLLKKFCSKYDGKKYVFEPSKLKEAMLAMGHEFDYQITGSVEVVRLPDGTFAAKSKDHITGWTAGKEGSSLNLPMVSNPEVRNATTLEEVDKVARCMVTPQMEHYGWATKTQRGWINFPGYDAVGTRVRQKFGKDAEFVKDLMLDNPWELCCIPFSDEYLDGRRWNKNAPQLCIQPSDIPGPHPHWDMIYDHLGKSLDSAVRDTDWCQKWGLQTGADYLRAWVSALVKFPMEPLPYLFFYGPQNSGKSIFHESLGILFTEGSIASASGALTNSQGFNYEIANCVIGFVEEKDLSLIKDTAYTRLKEWVTGRTLTITKKKETPYTQPNFLKMVQMANSPTACPMEDGDTRITAFSVSILGNKVIPKGLMERNLTSESPFFLRTILTTNLPETPDRLRVPMLASKDKVELESMNQKPWEAFASDALVSCPGNLIKMADFYKEYVKHCQLRNLVPEKPKTFLQLLRNRGDKFVIGVGPGKQNYLANVRLIDDDKAKASTMFELNEDTGRLVKCT